MSGRQPEPLVVPLPLRQARAVGGPVEMGLLAALAGVGLAGWLAAAATLVAAAPDLAAGRPGAAAPVLAAHLVALGLLPAAVTGASFHLLPVLLRTDLRGGRPLRLVPPLLAGGLALAPGIAFDVAGIVWPAAAAAACGLALVLFELARLILRAPRGRMLVASRTGVALTLVHVSAALVLGAIVFGHGDGPLGGVTHDRWVLVHLHVAILGWLTLLIVTVGRTLAPMLAQLPAAPARRLPRDELGLTLGLWMLAAGIAAGLRWLETAGGLLAAASIALFFAALLRSARQRRGPVEAPLVHMLAGLAFLAQAGVLGIGIATGAFEPGRALVAYVLFLLVGWAGGVVLGHIGKLLSLSLWVWWPPGPRPKQAALYPRRIWLGEAGAFAAGVETLGIATLAGNAAAARAGASLLCAGALLAVLGTALTWRLRP